MVLSYCFLSLSGFGVSIPSQGRSGLNHCDVMIVALICWLIVTAIGGILLAWLYTDSGKKWMKSL